MVTPDRRLTNSTILKRVRMAKFEHDNYIYSVTRSNKKDSRVQYTFNLSNLSILLATAIVTSCLGFFAECQPANIVNDSFDTALARCHLCGCA